jgi:urea transport system ATP-binding protein
MRFHRMAAVETSAPCRIFGEHPQLHVPAGGVMCLMGRNGVGKTTLLKSIMGLLPSRSGRIVFDGTDLGRLRPEERAACGIGYVPQGREIFPNLTVAENLRVGFLGRPKSAGNGRVAQADIEQVFDLFPKLKQLLSRKGGVLSGGEQQQLAIARVLLARPKLLLMDEPTEGIQPNVINQIEDAIQRIKERGIGVLLVRGGLLPLISDHARRPNSAPGNNGRLANLRQRRN